MIMKQKLLLFVGVIFLSVLLGGCAAVPDDGGKVPITTSSDKARKLFLKGRDLQERLRIAESRPYFEQAVAEDPEFALGHLFLALTAPNTKDFFASLQTARELANTILAGERFWIEGFAAGVNGDPQTQRKRYAELVASYPKSERAHNLLGGHFFGQQEWRKAIEQYRMALQINPEFSQSYNQLGYAHRFLGEYDEAEAAFKKYIEMLPDDPNPHDSYAELLMKLGRYDQSIMYYKKALELNPSFFNARLGIASNRNFKGEHDAARVELEKLYDNAANDGQRRVAHFGKAVSYVFQGNPSSALDEIQRMYDIAAATDDAGSMAGDLGTMGTLLCEFDKPDEALAKFEASLQMTLDSDLSQEQKELARLFHHFNLFQVAVRQGEYDAAREHAMTFRQQAEAKKNRFQIRLSHEMFGRLALAQQDYDTAISELGQANQQNPYNIYRLALAYEGKGDKAKAKQYLKDAVHFNALNNLNQALVAHHSGKKMAAK